MLWDKFGELGPAYALAQRALWAEAWCGSGGRISRNRWRKACCPASDRTRAISDWVGKEIFEELVFQSADISEIARTLLAPPPAREEVRAAALAYVHARQGEPRPPRPGSFDHFYPGAPMTEVIATALARYESSRFPGKPLALIQNKPMFWHVMHRGPVPAGADRGTGHGRRAHPAGGERPGMTALMTSPHHASGTDRVLEAARLLGASPDSVIVNVQGDEPALNPEMLTELDPAL